MVGPYIVFLTLLAGQRLAELVASRRNAARVFGQGGIESGQRHLLFIKILHGAFLVACAVEVVVLERPFQPVLAYSMLAVSVLAQAIRYSSIAALGLYWNVRVIVVPGVPAVTRGPYRFMRHPNYLAVVLEGIAVPLIHGAWLTSVVFTVANAVLLLVRIRCEEQALTEHCHYVARLGGRSRFIPRLVPSHEQ